MYNAILNKIEKIKQSYPEPQCYFLALILVAEFGGVILYDNNHCVVEYKGRYFDKKGFVDPEVVRECRFLPLYEYGWGIERTLITAMLEKHGEK